MNIYISAIKRKTFFIGVAVAFLFMTGCTHKEISIGPALPSVSKMNKIALYSLENYTDTPRAGMRAANIIEGVLLSNGYDVFNRISSKTHSMTLSEKIVDTKNANIPYLLAGGISEWRYKTGIDGEPAISLHIKLIDVKSKQVFWSSVGSDNSWGNASIGTVAQELITTMLQIKN